MPEVTRRRFLNATAVTAAAVVGPPLSGLRALAADASTEFSGQVDLASGFTVPAGEVWEFDPHRTTTVVVRKNVVVNGTLRMRPASPDVVHTLRFEGVDESNFVGGGMDVIESDVGLWIMGQGRLDARGAAKSAWNRTGTDPTWNSSDVLRMAPLAASDRGADGFARFSAGDAVPRFTKTFRSRTALSFVDTAESVHRYDIEAIYAAGITRGTSPTTYSPEQTVTRGQMAAFLVRALKLPAAPSAGFVDTAGHVFERDIDALYAAKITRGTTSSTFSPDDDVTRGQMAAFLVRALKLPPAPKAGFTDTDMHVFEAEIDSVFAAGITKGTSPTTYSPEDPVTRAQMASFLARALGLKAPEVRTHTVEMKAEVLNLTRNVRIQGTEGGRSHIFVRSSVPQDIRYVEISHMAPRRPVVENEDQVFSEGIPGRYGLHFHHCHDGSRGSMVVGVVVRDSGGHAFVPHMSHGITMEECISYNTFDDAYWWDPGDETHDTTWIRCVAALVKVDPEFRGYRLTGFNLGRGRGNVVRDSVAVGVLGNGDSSGFHWPEHAGTPPNVWGFEENVAHNCNCHGIFVWQNTSSKPHDIVGFSAFRCGRFGVSQGAYRTPYYHYTGGYLLDNWEGGIQQFALNGEDSPDRPDSYAMSYENIAIVGGENGFVTDHHTVPNESVPVLVKACTFADQNGPSFLLADSGNPGSYDVVDCELNPGDVAVDGAMPGTRLRVQNANGSAYVIDADGQAVAIGPFYR